MARSIQSPLPSPSLLPSRSQIMFARTLPLAPAVALLIACISVTAVAAQDRSVVWVHGFNEDEDTWEIYERFTERTYAAQGPSVDYEDRRGMFVFEGEVLGDGRQLNGVGSIGVGHSAGGVALRGAARAQRDGRYAGVITVGSPNSGVALVESIENGDGADVFDDACRALLAGPTSPLLAPIVRGIAATQLCDLLEERLIDPILGDFVDGQTPQDLNVGSDYIDNLNADPEPVPTISVWGNEHGPVHWRALSSAENVNDDTRFVDIADDMRDIYKAMKLANFARGPFGLLRGLLWQRGQRWIENSEGVYNALMDCRGGRRRVVRVETREIYAAATCNNRFSTGSAEWIRCINEVCPQGLGACRQTVTREVTVESNDESDGFICEESQVVAGLLEDDVYEARGVNHFEQVNATAGNTGGNGDVMERVFVDVFQRRGEGDIFTLPR